MKLQHLKTSTEHLRAAKQNKDNTSTGLTNHEITLQDVSESGSDFQFEKDDFDSSDSESMQMRRSYAKNVTTLPGIKLFLVIKILCYGQTETRFFFCFKTYVSSKAWEFTFLITN